VHGGDCSSVPPFALELAHFSVFIGVGEGERLREQQFSHRFDNCEEDPMKAIPVICLALIFATPAVAAPQWVETACWRYANRILPAPTGREREAYFANCIADWTAGTPPPQGRNSYSRNRY
jgi:hypothetical protein